MGNFSNKLSENTVEVTYKEQRKATKSYTGNMTIPSAVIYKDKIYNIVSIGDSTFFECRSLTSIEIPDRVTALGNWAFSYCINLTSIKIPDGVTEIGTGAFEKCSSLTSINIPDGVTEIASSVFWYCESLTSIKLPNGVTYIGDYSLRGCSGLTSINIPDQVTYIGDSAFNGCSGLTGVYISNLTAWCNINFEDFGSNPLYFAHNLYLNNELLTSISIPKDVTSIGNYAFYNCTSLTSIDIPDGVTSIGNYAFCECIALTSINIPNEVTSIGIRAFEGCRSLTEINIPDKVTSIASNAFPCSLNKISISSIEKWINLSSSYGRFGLSNYSIIVSGLKLTDLVVSENITTIGQYTFYGCTSLASITLHKGITTIVQNAFNGCTNVKKIVCQGDTPPSCGAKAFEGISRTECTLYVPETSGSNYQNTAPWSEFTNIVGGGTDNPDTPKTCETPTITFDNDAKKLLFTSATDGAECHYTVTSDDINTSDKTASEAAMSGVYTITAYASAEGMYNSEKTTAKLCWVSAAMESDGIMSAKADRGVIVFSNSAQINISGTIAGEAIEVYNVGGSKIKEVKANGENTTISGLQPGNVYVVKIGGTKVKVAM